MLLSPFSMVGVVVAIAFFCGGCYKEEGNDNYCRHFFVVGVAKKKKVMTIVAITFFYGGVA